MSWNRMGMRKCHYQNQPHWGYKAIPSLPIALQLEPQLMLQLVYRGKDLQWLFLYF
ncbi:hypothetical protein PQA67_gp43 [Yersinia phage vB_YenM_56.17]|uniref:Uncharacterized protein n=1 Tax=Yersinia phage vB_YenM_56.17 TaxID=2918927 RepID=A0AAE9JW50_9CAUD|nr:hypothetical protein PQA67_gp43 [Yersinia phage vB_YenM_56.17]UNA05931.1 hypothetical protein vBYenM5617_043 [Yersinia phage vB_YenM_56.17]